MGYYILDPKTVEAHLLQFESVLVGSRKQHDLQSSVHVYETHLNNHNLKQQLSS